MPPFKPSHSQHRLQMWTKDDFFFCHSRNYTSGYSTLRRQPNPCLKFQRQTVTTTINAAALNLVEVSGTDKRYGLLLDREAGANLVTVAVRCTLCSPSTVRIFFLLFDDAFFIYFMKSLYTTCYIVLRTFLKFTEESVYYLLIYYVQLRFVILSLNMKTFDVRPHDIYNEVSLLHIA